MELKKLDLTNAYQAFPIKLKWRCIVWTSHLNTGSVSIATSATPWTDDIYVLWPDTIIPLYWETYLDIILYVKSSVASWDVFYMIKN